MEYIIPVTKKQDEVLIEIAKYRGLSESAGELDLVVMLIDAEIERYMKSWGPWGE